MKYLLFLALFVLYFSTLLHSEKIVEQSSHIYRVASRDSEKAREIVENYLEQADLHEYEVVAHDDEHIYISKSQSSPVNREENDEDVRKPFALHKFINRHGGKVKYLGRHGRIPKSWLPKHLEALNNRVPKGYTPPSKMRNIFRGLAKEHNFVQWIDIAKKFSNATSIEKRPIHALRVNYKPNDAKPSVLFVSCHHARELITPEIALALSHALIEGYKKNDKEVMAWLELYDIWIVPVLNVDGHEHVWKHNNMWRKNRRPLAGGEFGVDLNRNYDLGWNSEGGSAIAGSETYRGAHPFSEPETQVIKKLSETMKFAKVMDFHSSGREVLVHYSRVPMPEIMRNFIEAEGKKLSKKANYGIRVPSDDGEHQEWQIKTNSAYSFLVETGTSFQPPYSEAIEETIRVWPLIKSFFNRPISVTGRVTDANGKILENVDIKVSGINWQLGETRTAHPKTGYFNLFLPSGEYTIQFSAPNHESKSVKVNVSDNSTEKISVQL